MTIFKRVLQLHSFISVTRPQTHLGENFILSRAVGHSRADIHLCDIHDVFWGATPPHTITVAMNGSPGWQMEQELNYDQKRWAPSATHTSAG